jgi:hypothetical protein
VESKGNLGVIFGSIGAVIVVILGVLFAVFKLWRHTTSPGTHPEMESEIPTSHESVTSPTEWGEEEFIGAEGENPIAPTIEAFDDSVDEQEL